MPGMRQPGMDHEYYEWTPIATRTPLRWPEGARVALCVVVSLEHYEWEPPAEAYTSPTMPGGVGPNPFPDICNVSHREYGNRVGIFRVMSVLDKHDIRATVAVDAAIAERCPFLIEECQKRGWEFISHGMTVNRMITSSMSEDEERQYISTAIEAIKKATGTRPAGWLGPEYGESMRTPRLLAEAGLKYVCDWPNDEQPYPMRGTSGSFFFLPMFLDLDDVLAGWTRHAPIMEWSRQVGEAFDGLYRDGRENGRLMVLNLHPWFIGQPYRIKYLDRALAHISNQQRVWKATGQEIVDWYAASR